MCVVVCVVLSACFSLCRIYDLSSFCVCCTFMFVLWLHVWLYYFVLCVCCVMFVVLFCVGFALGLCPCVVLVFVICGLFMCYG